MLKVGIYGGTFDPIHMGHLITANDILEKCGMDKVVFMPTGNPPHKSGKTVLAAEHRVNMIKAAIAGNDKLGISLIEAEREGATYTVDTMRSLTAVADSVRYYFIIGSDVVLDILSWKEVEEVFKLCGFLVMLREGYDDEKVLKKVDDLRSKYGAEIILAPVSRIDVSSTDVKKLINTNAPDSELEKVLPSGTLQYILENNLYVATSINDGLSPEQVELMAKVQRVFDDNAELQLESMYGKLKGFLSEKRLFHSLGTMLMAGDLAMKYGEIDVEHDDSGDAKSVNSGETLYRKALMAGLLHDCAKQVVLEEPEMIARCKQYGISEEDCGVYNVALMHAVLGEVYAKELFCIEDDEILSAIRYHTTGKAAMTMLEKIIYVSDSIEVTRNYLGIDELRECAFEDVDKCVYWLAENTISRIKKKGGYLHPNTVEAYDYYKRDY